MFIALTDFYAPRTTPSHKVVVLRLVERYETRGVGTANTSLNDVLFFFAMPQKLSAMTCERYGSYRSSHAN